MFSPLAFPEGLMVFDISSTPILGSSTEFSPFEVYRAQVIVIGIADGFQCCQDSNEITDPLRREGERPYYNRKPSIGQQHQYLLEASERMRDEHTKALVYQILVFDHPSSTEVLPEEVIGVPTVSKSTSTTIKTIMCDLAAKLLSEITSFAKLLQALPTVETPVKQQSPPQRVYQTGNESRPVSVSHERNPSEPANIDTRSPHRASMPPNKSSSSFRGSTPEIAALSKGGTLATSRGSEERDQSSTRSRSSIHSFGAGSSGEKERIKGKARIGIVIGSLFLLAGRWPDALKELSENGAILRAHSDYVWLAKALDYLLVTTAIYAWAGLDFRVRSGISFIASSVLTCDRSYRSHRSYSLLPNAQAWGQKSQTDQNS